MWRRTACFVAFVLAHDAALTSYGQDRPVVPLSGQCLSVRFELVMGRITALHLNAGQTRLTRGTEPESEIRETMQVNCEGPVPLVRYECQTASERVAIEITNGSRVSLQRFTKDDPSPQLDLQQAANGRLTVRIADHGSQKEYSAPTFWHLLLAERRICEQEVAPLLRMLRPGWDFSDAADRLETALYRAAQCGQAVPRSRLTELVAELGHREFQRRQAADRQLRLLGPVVIPYFASLDNSTLNNEQRNRIRQIRESVANAAADSPDRVAQWLVDDERIWVTLMTHHDAEKRHLAALRLTEIHPEAANFDPYADENYRQQQLAQLRLVLCPQ